MNIQAELTTQLIKDRLQQAGHNEPKPSSYPEGFFDTPARPASVLVPLFRHQNEWNLLFIRRSEFEGDRHSGQVAFPGGKVDDTDLSATHAALREAEEEVGLIPDQVTVLGELADYRTISNYLVKPVVAEIPWPVNLVPDTREVSRVFSIPLGWLLDPDNHKISERKLDGYQKLIQVIYFQRYDGELLWGITAKLTLSLLSVLQSAAESE